MANARPDRQQLQSYTIEDTEEVITVGDTVCLKSSEMYGRLPFVARVTEISADSNQNVSVYVRWYLKPDDTIIYRHEFHGEKELILMNLFESQAGSNIQEKCKVHTVESYHQLVDVEHDDYYLQVAYNSVEQSFQPDEINVFRKCEMLYNPDVFMAKCERCNDCYHLGCINLTIKELKEQEGFICSNCNS